MGPRDEFLMKLALQLVVAAGALALVGTIARFFP